MEAERIEVPSNPSHVLTDDVGYRKWELRMRMERVINDDRHRLNAVRWGPMNLLWPERLVVLADECVQYLRDWKGSYRVITRVFRTK